MVYVRNKNNKRNWLAILCTGLTLSDEEIVRIYGNRWNIEPFFKATKSLLKLGSEFQGKSYDMMISHTTIVFARYIVLEWLRRNEHDDKALGGIFYLYSGDIRDMDFITGWQSLMTLFIDCLKTGSLENEKEIKSQLLYWINPQACYIKALFVDLGLES